MQQTFKALSAQRSLARTKTLKQIFPFNKGYSRKCSIKAPSSRRSPASQQPAARLATLHPSLLLDAACAACCLALLASSASRHRQSSSLTSAQDSVAVPITTVATTFHNSINLEIADGDIGGAAPRTSSSLLATTPAPAVTVCALPAISPSLNALAGSAASWKASETVLLVVCTLLVAASNAWFKLSSSSRGQAAAGGFLPAPTLEAAARLARLEALTDKQLAEFATAVRQIDKLQVRTRLNSGDLRRPLAQLQSTSADQSAVMVRLAAEQEGLRGQLRDTQTLLAALQGLTAKQFQVTVEAIKQLRSSQAVAATSAVGRGANTQ